MASSMIISGTDFKGTDCTYGKATANKSGQGKSVAILGPNRKPIYLSTPLMLTWGLNENDFDGRKSYDMALQFPSENYPNAEASAFLDNLEQLEEKILNDAVINSKEWFNKPNQPRVVVEALYTRFMKRRKDPNTMEPDMTAAPTLRVKIPFWEGKHNIELYDENQHQIYPNDEGHTPMDLVQKGSNVALIIQCGGIWFAGGKFGVTWKLFQGAVKPKASLRGKCHISLSSGDKAKMSQVVNNSDDDADEGAVANSNAVDHVQVVDSDDEDSTAHSELAQELAPEPVPVPVELVADLVAEPVVVKKKVVRKKAVKTAENDN